MAITVALYLPYRSTRSFVTWSSERFAGTSKFSGDRDVQFFTVGNLGGRTLVIYVKNIARQCIPSPRTGCWKNKRDAQPLIGSRFGLRSQRSEWFRVCRVGFT
ncbi:hypothetical protein BDM02DRAFT_3273674 [Thelephora ganbajun]|uniref:Uncharacterized protein n=1 Tax=Thelephora ganbajun TaxID=370292 RepID=A0ACB6YXH3_THEGA|nr:hypothetical protein BDM02DRAFT_3273674 [Thelephora ganbajun]